MKTYKYLSADILALVDEDGLSRMSCSVENEDFKAWLAEGKTPEPADAPPTLTPIDQIAAIEAANPITHRNLRDLSMTVAQIAAAVTGTDPLVNPAVQQIVALEAQIAALRAQL